MSGNCRVRTTIYGNLIRKPGTILASSLTDKEHETQKSEVLEHRANERRTLPLSGYPIARDHPSSPAEGSTVPSVPRGPWHTVGAGQLCLTGLNQGESYSKSPGTL